MREVLAVSLLLLAAAVTMPPASAGSDAAAGADAGASPPAQANRPSIVVVGDGLTESAFGAAPVPLGFGVLLSGHYTRKADVVNRGFGGYFTPLLVSHVPNLFDVANPFGAVFFLGVKDSQTPYAAGSHYVQPEQFGKNVDQLIARAKAAGVQHILLVTPPPVCESCKAGVSPDKWDRSNAHTAQYVAQLRALASKHGAGLLDIFSDWAKDPSWVDALLLPDKLHLSAAGHQRLFDGIVAATKAQVPGMAWASLPLNYPLYDVINYDDPGPAFARVQANARTGLCGNGGGGIGGGALSAPSGGKVAELVGSSSSSSSSASSGGGAAAGNSRALLSAAAAAAAAAQLW